MCNFQMILLKPEIIIHIFKLLAYEDQLRLAKVSGHLRKIFETYVWKEKYRTLQILEKTHDFIVCSVSTENKHRLCLAPRAFEEFQKYYSHNVRELLVKNIVLDMQTYQSLSQISNGCMIIRSQLNLKLFQNLISLSYNHMAIPIHHLGMLTKWLPHLQELHLIHCTLDEGVIEVIRYVIPAMKNLKILCIQDFERFRITYGEFVDIMKNTQLSKLKITATIEPDVRCLMMDHHHHHHHPYELTYQNLQELYIQAAFVPQKWSSKYFLYLNIFKYLKTLTLDTVEEIHDATLATLAQVCQHHLQTLHIRFTIFHHIKQFTLPSKLTQLTLAWCRGLSYKNLRQIVQNTRIQKFHSKEIRYEGAICDLMISSRIRSLYVDQVITKNFLKNMSNNNKLQELLWYDDNNILDVTSISLQQFQHLRILDIQNGFLSLENIWQLKALYRLTMPHPVPTLDWQYMLTLLQHPHLRQLIIRDYSSDLRRRIRVNSIMPLEVIMTHISYLQIPMDLCQAAYGFWLQLFRCNRNLMQLRCSFYPHQKIEQFLRNLIEHSMFPEFIRNLDFCGFNVDCTFLRQHFEQCMKRLQSDMDYKRCWYEHETYYIALKRQ